MSEFNPSEPCQDLINKVKAQARKLSEFTEIESPEVLNELWDSDNKVITMNEAIWLLKYLDQQLQAKK